MFAVELTPDAEAALLGAIAGLGAVVVRREHQQSSPSSSREAPPPVAGTSTAAPPPQHSEHPVTCNYAEAAAGALHTAAADDVGAVGYHGCGEGTHRIGGSGSCPQQQQTQPQRQIGVGFSTAGDLPLQGRLVSCLCGSVWPRPLQSRWQSMLQRRRRRSSRSSSSSKHRCRLGCSHGGHTGSSSRRQRSSRHSSKQPPTPPIRKL